MKIAIAGPGRSGTSVLVRLLEGWGFSVPSKDHNWDERANAGLESRLGSDSPFDVDKDPWSYQYLHKLSDEQISKYSILIVPIRNLELAATSRSVIDRASRHDDGQSQYWMWNDWGTVPGGTVYSTSLEEQERILAAGLWSLLHTASSRGMKTLILNFPRFALDFEYLWKEVSPYLENRIVKSVAKEVFDSVIDASKIRQSSEKPVLSIGEAIGLLEEKSKSISSLSRDLDNLSRVKSEIEASSRHKEMELDQKKLELDQKKLELDQKRLEIEAIKNTLSWKTTLPLRKLRTFFGRSQK